MWGPLTRALGFNLGLGGRGLGSGSSHFWLFLSFHSSLGSLGERNGGRALVGTRRTRCVGGSRGNAAVGLGLQGNATQNGVSAQAGVKAQRTGAVVVAGHG